MLLQNKVERLYDANSKEIHLLFLGPGMEIRYPEFDCSS